MTVLVIAGCGSSTAMTEPDTGSDATEPAGDPAPELAGIDGWHNSEPLTLDELRGSPVLLVFFRDT